MKKFVSFLIGLAFTKNQFSNSKSSQTSSDDNTNKINKIHTKHIPTNKNSKSHNENNSIIHDNENLDSNNIEMRDDLAISIIIPPVICKERAFPVIATITNTRFKGSICVRNAKWVWNNKEYRSEIKENLDASGDSLSTVEEFRSRIDLLTNAEQRRLKSRYEKLRTGTTYLRFNIDDEMAKEVFRNGSVNLSLTVEGDNTRDNKPLSVSKVVKLKHNRTLQKPPPAPGIQDGNWYFGDTHSHSKYTWDYYFGDGIYTIPELKSLGIVAGLDWLTLTDHAYCLNSKKFETQKNTVTALSDSNFAFLYGEELSCAELVNNTKSRNTCHCNGIMNDAFVPCTTDIFRKASSPDSQQGINNIKARDGLVTINHANWGKGTIEPWNFNINTYAYTHGETGMEILNGGWSDTNKGSTTRWIDKRLLHGEKVFPFAGSDTESKNNLGKCYTVVYSDNLTQTEIKENLRLGHHYVTTYPGLAIWVKKAGTFIWSWMGDTLTIGSATVEVHLSYSDTTAGLNIYIIKGKKGWNEEQQVYSTAVSAGKGLITTKIHVEQDCYIRAYCKEENDSNHRAYTTPIWFE